MTFYNEPTFWAFLATFFGGVFGILKFWFVYEDRRQTHQAKLNLSVENVKAENFQKAIDYLNGVVARIEPLVEKHDLAMKDFNESIKIIGVIEKGLNAMSQDLVKRYDEFQRKLVNVTTSMQSTIDRVEMIDKKIVGLGKVIKL